MNTNESEGNYPPNYHCNMTDFEFEFFSKAFLGFKLMEFLKSLPFKSYGNMQINYSSPRAVFAHFLDQRNTGTTWSTTSHVSDTSYQCSQGKRSEKKRQLRLASCLRACADFHPRMHFILQCKYARVPLSLAILCTLTTHILCKYILGRCTGQ